METKRPVFLDGASDVAGAMRRSEIAECLGGWNPMMRPGRMARMAVCWSVSWFGPPKLAARNAKGHSGLIAVNFPGLSRMDARMLVVRSARHPAVALAYAGRGGGDGLVVMAVDGVGLSSPASHADAFRRVALELAALVNPEPDAKGMVAVATFPLPPCAETVFDRPEPSPFILQ